MNINFIINKRIILVLGCLTGMGALSIDMSLASIPFLSLDLSAGLSLSQYTVGFFMAGVGIGQIPLGLISDRIGRMPVLFFGLVIFVISGIVTSIANSIELILFARFIQGLGASVGLSISRAMVRDISSGKQSADILSAMMMIFTFIPMLAPIIGGFLVHQIHWRMPFIAITVFGAIILFGVKKELKETGVVNKNIQIKEQFRKGIREFIAYRISIFGMLLIVLSTIGYMSVITSSSLLIIEIYQIPVEWFGILFALTGLSVFVGSLINRRLLKRYKIIKIIGLGVILIGISSLSLLFIAKANQANFILLWGSVCLYMLGTGFLISNAMALALDPLPKIAGLAASIIGSLQNFGSSIGSIATGFIYNGSIRNVILLMGLCGLLTALIFIFGAKTANRLSINNS